MAKELTIHVVIGGVRCWFDVESRGNRESRIGRAEQLPSITYGLGLRIWMHNGKETRRVSP